MSWNNTNAILLYLFVALFMGGVSIGKAIIAIQEEHPILAGYWIMCASAFVAQMAIIFWKTCPF